LFSDRVDAGRLLAGRLKRYRGSGAVVFGIPRGGVVTAAEVARSLHLPLSVLVVRKLGAPNNPELAAGAVANDGNAVWNGDVLQMLGVGEEYKQKILSSEFEEVKRRLQLFGAGAALDVKDKVVIVVDDGIATGATMKAGVQCLRRAGAKKIVVAVPVCPPNSPEEFKGLSDEFVCLELPAGFQAVGQFYAEFSQVGDNEVRRLLKLSEKK
jgi:predicted phosphoribosyltransferase